MKEAIKLAVREGYSIENQNACFLIAKRDFCFSLWHSVILLDPLFWQALGKALGWEDPKKNTYTRQIHSGKKHLGSITVSRISGGLKMEWKRCWHRFIDHLAEGKDVESFFTTLSEETK